MKRIPVPRVLKTRCLKMVTFEKHILDILNRKLLDEGIRGVFYIVKSYNRGVFPIQKRFKVTLYFTNSTSVIEIEHIEKTITVREGDVQDGYDEIFRDLLYKMIFTDGIWNSISTKLP